MPFCTQCGQETNGANYCPNCGAPQPAQSQGDAVTYDQSANAQQAYDGAIGYDASYAQPVPPDANAAYNQQYAYGQPQAMGAAPAVDTGSFGWAVLGFLIPLVGLILFLVWKDTKPLSAKRAGVGALVSVIVSIVLSILMSCAGLALYSVYS